MWFLILETARAGWNSVLEPRCLVSVGWTESPVAAADWRVSASLCAEWSESDMAAGGTVKTRKQQRWLRTRENRETRIKNKITYDGREPLLMADKWWRRTGVVED